MVLACAAPYHGGWWCSGCGRWWLAYLWWMSVFWYPSADPVKGVSMRSALSWCFIVVAVAAGGWFICGESLSFGIQVQNQ